MFLFAEPSHNKATKMGFLLKNISINIEIINFTELITNKDLLLSGEPKLSFAQLVQP